MTVKFHNIIHLLQTESTNTYCKENLRALNLPCLVYTDFQTKGRGQQNNIWYSEPSKNLLCSLIIPLHIPTENYFYISEWASVLLYQTITLLSIPEKTIKIKWPNDIIIHTSDGYKKIAGILIENILDNNTITHSIIGIGLNINQTEFGQLSKTATSATLITQKHYIVKNIAELLLKNAEKLYSLLQLRNYASIEKSYIKHLYGWQQTFLFKHNQDILQGKIIEIKQDGKILVEANNQYHLFNNKEIQFLI